MKIKFLIFTLIVSFVTLSFRLNSNRKNLIGVDHTLNFYTRNVSSFTEALDYLNKVIQTINHDSSAVVNARQALQTCRLRYKRIEFFTSYFFPSETRFYNAAPKFEVEEPTLELIEPMGLQQIESLLFANDVPANKDLLLTHVEALLSSAQDLPSLLYNFEINDRQVLESLRIQLIRMSVLSISGYDAPSLKSGITETAESTQAIQEILQPYLKAPSVQGQLIKDLLKKSLVYLRAHPDFNSFNRMEYLTQFALPLQQQLGLFIKENHLELNTTAYLNYDATHIFSRNAIKSWGANQADTLVYNNKLKLGRILFFDKSLSANASVSCASCHQPDNYFADRLALSPSINPDSALKRNTPTLLYAGKQHKQFWDGRANNLTEQIQTVILSPLEMKCPTEKLQEKIFSNSTYKNLFALSFPEKDLKNMGITEISEAIGSFVDELNPMNSAFDRYINGDKTAMNTDQIKGFNLFMGKAQCGTCHFPPYFNSLLPPFYHLSEVEIVGTTKTENFKAPEQDADPGRFSLYPIRYYNKAFKTPTVRNAAQTAPYMHNGAFSSLASLIEFYNLGGGNGLGLDVPEQTLSASRLNLSETEIKELISFIESLTDSPDQTFNFKN